MSERNLNRDFSEMVDQRLNPNAKELWRPMAQEFLANGPEAVKGYLEVRRKSYETHISTQLRDFNER